MSGSIAPLVLDEHEGVRVRVAQEADGGALCDLVGRVPMGGGVRTVQDRRPDFFALPRLHGGPTETFVAETGRDHVGGSGTYSIRQGYLEGRRVPVGYISDLRFELDLRRSRALPRMGRLALERGRDLHGSHVYMTAVIDHNRPAVATATHRAGARREQPISSPITPYEMVSVPVRRGLRMPPGVATAGPADVQELERFLDGGARTRPFGQPFAAGQLLTRIASWPGLTLADFLLARDASGGIVGCAAPWDPNPVKRTIIAGFQGMARLERLAYNAWASLAGAAPIPGVGGTVRTRILSHVEIADDDPHVFRALLDAALVRAAGTDAHFVSAMMPRRSPLRRAVRGPVIHRLALTLYAVTLPDGPWAAADLATDRPGFEMALA